MKFVLTIGIAIWSIGSAFAAQEAILEAWKGFSTPEIFASGFIHDFKSLPLEGSVDIGPKAWSGDYWSSKKGSINYRWNHPLKQGFDYSSPTKAEAQKMSVEELATLAPSEKYDLFLGRYDYPMKSAASGVASKLASDWAGICHGWAPASAFHNEPTPKLVTNPDGIVIPFGSADIKALLSYYYAFHHKGHVDQMGLRCFLGSWLGGARGCGEDLNAGAFHIVMANKLGLLKEPFMVDIERFREVWNQPVVAFKSRILADNLRPSRNAAKKAVKGMRIATEFYYVDESDPTWDVVHGTKNQLIEKRDFQYRIELDAEGKIVGGEWESRERPDFIWNVTPATTEDFKGIFSELPKLLND